MIRRFVNMGFARPSILGAFGTKTFSVIESVPACQYFGKETEGTREPLVFCARVTYVYSGTV